MLFGLVLGVWAQTCAVMLPEPGLEFEWYRDGRAYAHDVLIRRNGTQRVYQRRLENGSTTERVVSCIAEEGTVWLTERVGTGATVRIPVALQHGAARRGGVTVRPVPRPPGSADNMVWFAVADPGIRLYGMRRGAGITEVRTPMRGGFSVLRAVASWRQPDPVVAANDSQVDSLALRVQLLEAENRALRDSLEARRRAGPAPRQSRTDAADPDALLLQLPGVREAAEQAGRLEFDAALHTLEGVRRRLHALSTRAGRPHDALAPLDSAMRRLLAECIAFRTDPPPGARIPTCSTEDSQHP